jgi:hypothetical protein
LPQGRHQPGDVFQLEGEVRWVAADGHVYPLGVSPLAEFFGK